MRVAAKSFSVIVMSFVLCALAGAGRAAQVDVSAGALVYLATNAPPDPPNQLTISVAGGTYTVDDPGEATINLAQGALAAGCAPVDSNTVTCPGANVTSLDIATTHNDDTIVLVGATAPAEIEGGPGGDVLIGGGADDTFSWNPGDGSDAIDGGPGVDTLVFKGTNTTENYSITPDGAGFDLNRDAGTHMEVENAEVLDLWIGSGNDSVSTAALAGTVQFVRDGASDGFPDSLLVDAQGHCAQLINDGFGSRYEVVGLQPIHFEHYGDFNHLFAINSVCGGVVDVGAGVLRYTDSAAVANQLSVSQSAERYLIDDPGEATVTLDDGAVAAGCVSVDANTASCPQSVVTSFEISTGAGNDQIDLSGSLVPSLVLGGTGQDQIIGGTEEDTFVWNVHDGSDTIDGGPGSDSLVFNGNHMGETIGIQTDGAGFVLYRDLGNILLQVSGTELLEVWTFEGEDRVFTNALVDTTQRIVDDANDLIPTDTLTVDAQGLCLTRKGDTFNVETRQPIEFVHFTSLVVENNCGVDPCATALATQGCVVNGVPNQLCVGTPGDDKIAGTTGADVIKGGGGRDRIRGGAGADLLCGEAGDDVLIGGQDNDTIVGWSGQDQLKGDAGNDYLLGGPDGDVVSSGTGDDYIDGEKGDDRLRGQAGFDSIQGGPGFDLINGGAAIDVCGDVDQSGPFPSCED